jgi:hypothetical protein
MVLLPTWGLPSRLADVITIIIFAIIGISFGGRNPNWLLFVTSTFLSLINFRSKQDIKLSSPAASPER